MAMVREDKNVVIPDFFQKRSQHLVNTLHVFKNQVLVVPAVMLKNIVFTLDFSV